MESGIISSFEKERGIGIILTPEGRQIEFYANSVITRDRTNLEKNDKVFFETQINRSHRTAINIRKCVV